MLATLAALATHRSWICDASSMLDVGCRHCCRHCCLLATGVCIPWAPASIVQASCPPHPAARLLVCTQFQAHPAHLLLPHTCSSVIPGPDRRCISNRINAAALHCQAPMHAAPSTNSAMAAALQSRTRSLRPTSYSASSCLTPTLPRTAQPPHPCKPLAHHCSRLVGSSANHGLARLAPLAPRAAQTTPTPAHGPSTRTLTGSTSLSTTPRWPPH